MHQSFDIIRDRDAKGKQKPKRKLADRETLLRRLWADHDLDGRARHG